MNDQLDTSVVIVNHRTKVLTRAAVASVLPEPEVREVLVVDNASGDDSLEYLRHAFSDGRVRVLASERNVGFGPAVNLAAAECRSPLLFILNSDATLVPGSLGRLAKALVGDGVAGVIAPLVYDADGRALQAGAYGRLPARRDIVSSHGWARMPGGDSAGLHPGWVSGVAMLLRRSDFLGVGGFDETFGMYLEDVDLCRRLRDVGKSTRREPTAAVLHQGGASWRDRRQQRRRFHESKVRYFEKLGASSLELRCVRVIGRIRTGLER